MKEQRTTYSPHLAPLLSSWKRLVAIKYLLSVRNTLAGESARWAGYVLVHIFITSVWPQIFLRPQLLTYPPAIAFSVLSEPQWFLTGGVTTCYYRCAVTSYYLCAVTAYYLFWSQFNLTTLTFMTLSKLLSAYRISHSRCTYDRWIMFSCVWCFFLS